MFVKVENRNTLEKGRYQKMINLNTKVLKRLQDGAYTVTVSSYNVVNNDKGGYIALDLAFPDRNLTWNVFPTQFNYVFGMLQQKFGLENQEVSYKELLDLASEREFEIYTDINEYGRNYSLTIPVTEEESSQQIKDIIL